MNGREFFFQFSSFLYFSLANFLQFLSLPVSPHRCLCVIWLVWFRLLFFAYFGIPMRLYNPKKKKKKFSCSTLTFLGLIFSFFIGVSISLFFGKKKIQNFFKIEGHFLTKNKIQKLFNEKNQMIIHGRSGILSVVQNNKKKLYKKDFLQKVSHHHHHHNPFIKWPFWVLNYL